MIFIRQYNNTPIGLYKVLRGKEDIRDLGRVIEVDGKTEMKIWNGESCNQIKGTDGTKLNATSNHIFILLIFQLLVFRIDIRSVSNNYRISFYIRKANLSIS